MKHYQNNEVVIEMADEPQYRSNDRGHQKNLLREAQEIVRYLEVEDSSYDDVQKLEQLLMDLDSALFS